MKIKKFIVGPVLTNCYLLETKNYLAIIDPGFFDESLSAELALSKKKLKYIICTHYHFDHTGAVKRLRELYPQAKVLIHANEEKYLKHYFDDQKFDIVLGEPGPGKTQIEKDSYVDPEVDRFLQDREKIDLEDVQFEVVLTPGHTKGSICLFGDDVVFSGDTIFEDGAGRTDLNGGDDADLNDSLERLSLLIKAGMHVYPGHGNDFEAGE